MSHCDVASYTNLSNKDRLYRVRVPFFEALYKLAEKCAAAPIATCLDFGSSYGHFLRLLKARGCDAVGIEIVDAVRTSAEADGLTVFKSLDQLARKRGTAIRPYHHDRLPLLCR